jgi:hypothetical protein
MWQRIRPMSLDEFVMLLAGLAAQGKVSDMIAAVERHPWLRRQARRMLRKPEPGRAAIQTGELIAAAWIAAGVSTSSIVADWMLPLLKRTTERYLEKMVIARYLIARLDSLPRPETIVSAIEASVTPRSQSDYSNFRGAFSMRTWTILRRCLTQPRLMSELDLFVTATDREVFWTTFNEAKPS